MKAFILDDLAPVCGDHLRRQGFEVEQAGRISQVRHRLAECHALLVRSASTVKAEDLDLAPNLRVIGRGGVGLDNIDVAAASARRIAVISTPDANTISTAELTVALMLALARWLPMSQRALEQGSWKRNEFRGTELFGKTLGVVGFGRIGQAVAVRALALGMQVTARDPLISAETMARLGVESCELAALLARSDFITLHVPLNDSTWHLINAASLAGVKRGARLINCARGGVTDESAVRRALDSGQLSGVALDVYAEEPPAKDHPLIGHPRVVCVPHLGALTEEAQTRAAEELAKRVADHLLHRSWEGVVNADSIDRTS